MVHRLLKRVASSTSKHSQSVRRQAHEPGSSHLARKSAQKKPGCLSTWCTNRRILVCCIITAAILGLLLGLALHPSVSGVVLSRADKAYLRFPGEIYIRMLRLMVVPLVIGGSVSTTAMLSVRAIRQLALATIAVFFFSCLAAETVGVLLSIGIKPGQVHNSTFAGERRPGESVKAIGALLALVQSLVPDNIIRATFQKDDFPPQDISPASSANETLDLLQNITGSVSKSTKENVKEMESRKQNTDANETNVLGLIAFSTLFGIGVRALGAEVGTLASLFRNLHQVMVFLASILLYYAPVGIMFLIAFDIVDKPDFLENMKMYKLYVATELGALAIYSLIIMPITVMVFTRESPLSFVFDFSEGLLTSFGTASSDATLPVSLYCIDRRRDVDRRVPPTIFSLGTTLHMPGTAMHHAITVIFLSQWMQIPLSVADYLLIIATSMLTSLTTQGVSVAHSATTSAIILQCLGIPNYDIIFLKLIPIDWFLDKLRTVVNVWTNYLSAVIIDQICSTALAESPAPLSFGQLRPLQDVYNEAAVQGPATDILQTLERVHRKLKRRWRYKYSAEDVMEKRRNEERNYDPVARIHTLTGDIISMPVLNGGVVNASIDVEETSVNSFVSEA